MTWNSYDSGAWRDAISTKDEGLMLSLIQENRYPDRGCIQRLYELYREKQIQNTTMDMLLEKMSKYIKTVSNKIIFVTACFTLKTPDEIVFIVVATEELHLHIPYNIRLRLQDVYNDEGAVVSCHEKCRHKQLTPQESKAVAVTIQKHADAILHQHSNVQMISACSVKSRGFGTAQHTIDLETCIVIYVSVKGYIPFNETALPKSLNVPETNDYIPVDVREGGMKLFGNAKEYHTNIKMGCQITGDTLQGTVGAFIDRAEKTYCLTCAHMFYDNQHFVDILSKYGLYISDMNDEIHAKVTVYQNKQGLDTKFGAVALAFFKPGNEAQSGVDLAVVEISERHRLPKEGFFPDGDMSKLGFDRNVPMQFVSGMAYLDKESFHQQVECTAEVFKYGSETGFTKGVLLVDGLVVRRTPYQGVCIGLDYRLNAQLVVSSINDHGNKPFAAVGDSGAFVFAKHGGNKQDLRAVGMVVGGTSDNNVLVTPIWEIFQILKDFRFCSLKKFDSP